MGQTECPVSQITPDSRRLIQIIAEAGFVRDSTRAMLHGMDTSEWPARFHDAVVIVAEEEQRVKDAAEAFSATLR